MKLRAASAAIAALCLAFSMSGCEQEGPAERAGKKLDEAVEQAGKQLDEAAREAGEKLEEAGETLQERPDR